MAICCPKTFTGFCLDDQTPIAITIDNGVLISWTNLVTGVITPGNPPAGTGVCEVPSVVTVEIEPLTCAKDEVTVCQGTSPWIVSGTVALDAPTLAALETITVNQGTSPWVVSGAVDVSNFPASIEVSNDVGNPLPVSGTVALDAPTLAALETITVNQGTSPWIIGDGGGSITIDAIDLDIRDLVFATDKVDVSGSTVTVGPIVGAATEATLLDVKRSVTDFRTLLDYDIRLDGNPVYVGKNLQTALTSAATWVIQKLFYDISNRLIDAQVLTGSWDGRAALAWKPAGGN